MDANLEQQTRAKDPLEPDLPRSFERLWTGACLALAAWLCLRGLAGVFLIGDELHSLRNIDLGFVALARTYDRFGSGLALPMLQRLASGLFGHELIAYRLPAIAGALATLLFVGPLARRLFGAPSALLASAAVATSAIHVYYSRYGRGYALGAFLALLFVLSLLRTLEHAPARRRWLAGIVLAGGFLPAVHLSTGPFLLAAGAAALWNARRDACLLALGYALAAGALLALLLHVSARASLREFLDLKLMEGAPTPFGPLDVATALAGSRVAGWVVLVGLPLAGLAFLRRQRARAALVLAGPLGLIASLLLTRPPGLALAYARYLFVAWPMCLMLLAWGWVELARRLPLARRAGSLVALAAGLALLAGAWLAGPLGRAHVPDGRFANSNLALHALPAFDADWKRSSNFYAVLAEMEDPQRIAEFPGLRTRNLMLYRNHWLQHRKDVVLGHLRDPELAPITHGPYADLSDLGVLEDKGIDFVVVHHNIDAELANYWTFVQDEAWPALRRAGDDAAMAALSDYGIPRGNGRDVPELERALRKRLGRPAYADATVRVWEVAR